MGDDAAYDYYGERYSDHVPRHSVTLQGFALARFPVTNAEWSLFAEGGGYDDPRWWPTAAAAAWQAGEGTAFSLRAGVRHFREAFRFDPERLESAHRDGIFDDAAYSRWQLRLDMTDAEFEEHLLLSFPGGRLTRPRLWSDSRFNAPLQPVVGVSWFEALAYCAWLSAQSGLCFRLPTEIEWEAAARGAQGRRFAFGDDFGALRCNTVETHVRAPSPIGVFPDGDTPDGLADMTGNVWEWTSAAWGESDTEPAFPYPYCPEDGRERLDTSPAVRRVLRGGSWLDYQARVACAYRLTDVPDAREGYAGFRVALSM